MDATCTVTGAAAASVELTDIDWSNSPSYTCRLDMSETSRMVTISVDSGYFTIPSIGTALTYQGGTNASNYIDTYSNSTQYDSIVFSFSDVAVAETLLSAIIYTPADTTQKITATSSTVSPIDGDLYFEGHFYRYVPVGLRIDWPSAVVAAGSTADTHYFGGRGYIATATSQAENSILLKLTDTGGVGDDHWYDAWMGGLWQRNTGTVDSPTITRGIDGNEITYTDLSGATSDQRVSILKDFSQTYSDDTVCTGTTSGKYIYEHSDVVRYYWIDGPEAGQEIAYNTTDFSPWHGGEPNGGDFVYIGWEGAYWDDLSAYNNDTGLSFDKLDGYIVEFSGFNGGSTASKIASATKTVNSVYTVTLNTNGGTVNSGDITSYTYGVGATLPTDVTKSGATFGGWFDNESLTGDAVTTISTTDTGNKAFWAKWTSDLSVNLGNSVFSNDTDYSFPDLTLASSINIGVVTISVDKAAAEGSTITLPNSTPGGDPTVLTDLDGLTKTVVFASAQSASNVQAYLRAVQFALSPEGTQTVTMTTDANQTSGLSSTMKLTAFYNHPDGTTHYYLYAGTNRVSWVDAYNAAKNMKFMGMTGYLPTITSEDENNVLHNISENGAWSGGTRLKAGGTTILEDPSSLTSNDYAALNTTTDYFYWACGPEAGLQYYTGNNTEGSLVDDAFYDDAPLASFWYSGEPNNANGNEAEQCMQVNFNNQAWNDVPYTFDGNLYYFVEFGGYIGSTGTIKKIANDPGSPDALLTVSASATVVTYTITYNLNDGTNPDNAPTGYTHGTSVTLPTPTKSNFTFGGWFDNESLTGNAVTTISTTDTGNKAFWAKWSIIPITAAGVTGMVAPSAGGTPIAVGSLTAEAGTYTVTSLTWKNNDGTAATLTPEEKFKADTIYKAEIELTSAVGNKFQASGFTPTVNAGTAGAGTVSGGDVEGNKLTFMVTFDTTAAQSVTGIGVTIQPTKMSYTESTDGILALNGMAITETYNDGSTGTVTFTDGTAAGYTASPVNGDTLTNAAHNNIKVTITHTASSQTAQTVNLTVNPVPDTQATPSFSPASDAIAFGSTVTITSAGADHIYYTTDGTNPATTVGGSTLEYTAPVTVNAAVTIKAIAVKAGNLDSDIGSASYTQAASADLANIVISGTPANFTFAGSTYTYNGVTVANGVSGITVTPSGAGTITVDGTLVTSGQASESIALTAGVEKTITVVVTETGKSPKTYTIKVTREVINAPAATAIQSAVAGDGQVTITWSNVSGATSYKVYKSSTSGTYGAPEQTVAENVYSYDAVGLTNGTTYYFVVKASNAGGDSINSNEVSATPQVAAPGAPVLQTAVAGDGRVTLTWSAIEGSDGYKVYESTASGTYTTPANTVAGSVYSCEVIGLNNGMAYYFVVKSSNPGGDSAYSNEVSATPQVSAPSAPTGVTATAGNAKVVLNWTGVSGATGYKIYQAASTEAYESPLTTVAGDVYSYDATALTNGTIYYFVIKATNEGGDSTNSVEVSAMPKTVPGTPTNVSAIAGNGEATITFTAPADNGGSPITGYIVTSGPSNITATGTGTTITVTGLTNGTTYTFTVKAVNAVGNGADSTASNSVTPRRPSSGGSSSGNTTPATPTEPTKPTETGVEIQVNGKVETAATATTIKVDEKTVTTVTVDDKKVEHKLEEEGKNAVVTIPVNNNADVVVGQLNGQTVKNMETKEAVLEIKTANVTYTLPASEINIDAVSSQIGQQVELKDIKVNVTIAAPPQDTVKVVENTASKNNYQVVIKPVDFEITCTSGNKTVDVSKFNGYVERTVAIPDGVDPSKITTGIVLNGDGTFSHVPTTVTEINGKYYAKINSLTNSTYSVIYSPKTFKDVENHWAKDQVNDMGSRLVISGVCEDKFDPDRDITRAEYAAIVVRALGLMRSGAGKDIFTDMKKDAWYYDAVTIAYEYGIISGYGNGKFGSEDKITREQAMTMISRAMVITKLKAEYKSEDAKALLADFGDSGESSEWAKEHIAKCIKAGIVSGKGNKMLVPKDNITRAEVAAITRRLLQKSNLIN
ncbi:S-layer homology domain-containing protein [Acetivibrio cellulolyticus]